MQIEYRGSGQGNTNLSGWVRKKDALVMLCIARNKEF